MDERLTKTKWNTRTSKPRRERFVCSKRYVCHQSAFMKVSPEENKRSFSKNSYCTATINIKVKLNTSATRKKDPFVKKGLFAIITINDAHNHSLDSTEALKLLPSSDCKGKFHEYFKNGMGIAEASKYHEERLRSEENFTEADLANSQINPPYRVVQYWFNQWSVEKVGPRIVSGRNKTSSTSVKQEIDPSLVEPIVKIKEEPVDDYPDPSTSVDNASEEFILPDKNNSWALTDSVVLPQVILSVASLASPNKPETSDAQQPKKKPRTNSSETEVTSPNDAEVRTQNPELNFECITNPSSSTTYCIDQFDAFGVYVATKLRSFDAVSSSFVQKAIRDLILEAEMGKYRNQSQGLKS